MRFDFGMSVSTFVGFCNAEYKSSFFLRFISVAQRYSPEQRTCLNVPLKCIIAKIKTSHKGKIFIPKLNLFFCPNSLFNKAEKIRKGCRLHEVDPGIYLTFAFNEVRVGVHSALTSMTSRLCNFL